MTIEDFLFEIDEMLDDEQYHFARTTLEGIRANVATNSRITDQQARAVSNIRASKTGEKREGPQWKRRYEGF